MSDMDYLDDENEGRDAGRKSFMDGQPAKYFRHPKRPSFVLRSLGGKNWTVLGRMSELPYAAGYILGREEAARQKEFKKALGKASSLSDKLKEEVAIDTTVTPYHAKARIPDYPIHLTYTLTAFRQKENLRDGYADGKKARLAHQPCPYRVDKERIVWERPFGQNDWIRSDMPYIYVKGFLSGWQGQKAPENVLRLSAKAESITPAPEYPDPDVLAESNHGWTDGVQARGLFGPLKGVRAPYMFKNKKLWAYVTQDQWTTYSVPVEDVQQYAYASAFIKGWRKWERTNLKSQIQPVRRARRLRQFQLSLEDKEHE